MAAHDQSLPPIITEHPDQVLIQRHNNATISDKIAGVVLAAPTPKQWFVVLGIAFLVLQFLPFAMGNLLLIGVGKFGINQPVGWGMDIINFVWWIGIGHAGTLISAILMLFRQEWRMAIARFAEAMTIFAVMCAGMYPVFHTGRPWLAYWLLPYPNTMAIFAATAFTARVGRVRGFDVRDRVDPVLVCRSDPRLRDDARQEQDVHAVHLCLPVARLAQLGQALAPV